MEETEILQLYQLNYSDLISLSTPMNLHSSSSNDSSEIKRLESISKTVMETLGPSGPGLLSITGVAPDVLNLRDTLLPFARKLALLDRDDLKRILKKHGLGSDVPLKNTDRSVSSFALQLKYLCEPNLLVHENVASHNLKQDLRDTDKFGNIQDGEFEELGNTFKKLGFCMIELGLSLARVCDKAIGGRELEQSLLDSGTAKGRLIHYHSSLDNLVLKRSERTKKAVNRVSSHTNENQATSRLWQHWHFDYGTFTVLTDPLFILPSLSQATNGKDTSCETLECPSTTRHTYLQILNSNTNKIQMVKSSPGSFIIQVGESADILSKGKLRSTLHSVSRPQNLENSSRETFVVFLQPAWSKRFSVADYPTEQQLLGDQSSETSQEIMKIVPPLSSRLKDGMTFAEFSWETTKQYYGGQGLQSNR